MKFKAKTKDCQLFIKVKTSFGENIDSKELDRFSRIYLRGFLKPKLVKRINLMNKDAMHNNAKYLIEQVKSREEKDNISVLLIKAE